MYLPESSMLWNLCLSYRWVSTSFKRSWALEAGDKPFLSLHPSIHPNPCAVSYWECRQDSESDLRSTLSGGMGWLSRSWVQILALDTGWQQQMGYLVSWTIFEAIGTRWLCSLRRWSPSLSLFPKRPFHCPLGESCWLLDWVRSRLSHVWTQFHYFLARGAPLCLASVFSHR